MTPLELAERIYNHVNSLQRHGESWDKWDDKREIDFIRSLIDNNFTFSQTEISDEEIDKFLKSFPYTKHLDDGQYNDGVIVGAELGIEWYREQLKKKQ